jgi:hypothetical protein
MLRAVPKEMRAETQWQLRRRLACHTLVEFHVARACPTFQADPVRAISDSDLRRVLTRAWLPRAIVERCGDEGSG